MFSVWSCCNLVAFFHLLFGYIFVTRDSVDTTRLPDIARECIRDVFQSTFVMLTRLVIHV